MKILVGVACMDECKSRFAQSLAGLWHFCQMEFFFAIGNGVAESRDIISHYAMDNDFDYVCFIDSDETFRQDAVSSLVADDKDIVTGLVHHRKPPYKPVLMNYRIGWEQVEDFPKNEPFTVDCSGGGACTLIKTDVLRKIYDTYGEIWFPYPKTTEDLSFAHRVREQGYKWWCDPRVKIGHIGVIEVVPD